MNFSLDEFCQTCNLESIVNKATCLKNPKVPSCAGLVLTNKQEQFPTAKTVETGLSDFHKMLQKTKAKVRYRDYKRFDNKKFREILIIYLNTAKNVSFDAFENSVLHTLGKMTPIKQKYIRDKQSLFMNKTFVRL